MCWLASLWHTNNLALAVVSEDLKRGLKRQNVEALQILIGNSFPKSEGQQRKEHDWACLKALHSEEGTLAHGLIGSKS